MGAVSVETYENGKLIASESMAVPDESVRRDQIEATARQALATNRAYAALANPTAAQTTAEVKALARQMNGVIRLLLNALDGTD